MSHKATWTRWHFVQILILLKSTSISARATNKEVSASAHQLFTPSSGLSDDKCEGRFWWWCPNGKQTQTYTENTNRYKVRRKLKRAQGKARPTLSLLPAVRDGGNYTGHYWVGGGLRGGGWLLQGLPTAHPHPCRGWWPDQGKDTDTHRNWVRGGLLLPTSMRMMTIILVMVMWMIVASSWLIDWINHPIAVILLQKYLSAGKSCNHWTMGRDRAPAF